MAARLRKLGTGGTHGGERALFSTSAGLLSRLPVTFGIMPERLDGFFNQDLAAADSEWDQLFANPADQGQTVMYSIINFHSGYFHDNPLSPPCIPPKFVLHGLSSKSKFLAVI